MLVKKLNGFSGIYMLGALAGVAIISTTLANEAMLKNQEYDKQYIKAKKENINNLKESLKHVYSTDSGVDGSVTQAKLEHHVYTNLFNVNNSQVINQSGTTSGDNLGIIGEENNKYKQNLLTNIAGADILTTDLSGFNAMVFSEGNLRKEQIYKSYENMKKQSKDIYQSIISSSEYKFPCTLTNTQKDSWGSNFAYNRIDDANVEISFNLPWDTGVKKSLKLALPVLLEAKDGIKEVYHSEFNTYILTNKGKVWVAGKSNYGQLGLGDTNTYSTFTETPLRNIKKFVLNYDRLYPSTSAYAITESGKLWVAGKNDYGQMGVGSTDDILTWTETTLNDVKDVYTGGLNTAYAVTNSGELWVTGRNDYGQMGVGDNINQTTWVKTSLSNIISISTSTDSNAYAISSTGDVWSAGLNDDGQLGIGSTVNENTWTKVSLINIKDVFTDGESTFFVDNIGDVWAAGNNGFSQLGIGSSNYPDIPEKTILSDIKEVKPGGISSFALSNSGYVYVAGLGSNGQFGLNDTSTQNTWVESLISDVEKLTVVEGSSSYAIKYSGELWVTGRNNYGQLGVGSTDKVLEWQKINIPNIKDVFATKMIARILTDTGDVWVAGYGYWGALGIGDSTNRISWDKTSLVDIINLKEYGSYHTLAVSRDDELWVTGRNQYRPLGVTTFNMMSFVKAVGEGATDITAPPPYCP